MSGSIGFLTNVRRELDDLAMRDPAIKRLGSFDQLTVGLARFSDETPWEIHPDGDELLYVLTGRVRVTLLPERADEPSRSETLDADSLFVLPRGLWHRQTPEPTVCLLFVTPAEATRHSSADDPRDVQGDRPPGR